MVTHIMKHPVPHNYLIEYMEGITQALGNGNGVDIIYLDFQKAFDKVPHKRLLKKLHAYEIRGQVYERVKEFLNKRQQRVTINGSKSDWRNVTSGIPQSSVLGPVLYLVFINDFSDVIEVLLKLFAEDAKVYNIISSLNDVQPLQRSVNNAGTWSIDWDMLFNIQNAISYMKVRMKQVTRILCRPLMAPTPLKR